MGTVATKTFRVEIYWISRRNKTVNEEEIQIGLPEMYKEMLQLRIGKKENTV